METRTETAEGHCPREFSPLGRGGRPARSLAPLALALVVVCAPGARAASPEPRQARILSSPAPAGYVNGLCFGARPTIAVSGPGARGSVVEGTAGDDVIVTRNGSYTISGGGGDDRICAVGGNNTIDGGTGKSLIAASGAGNNTIDAPNSRCYIGSGHNVVHCTYVERLTGTTPGGAGGPAPKPRPKPRPTAGPPARMVPIGYINGLCFGSKPTITVSNLARPIVNGTGGNDVIVTRNGNYTINAGHGNVKICAVGGDNTINGGPGKNLIWSSPGNNRINGGSGEDWIITGPGNDIINGGSGVSHCDAGAGGNVVRCTYAGRITRVPAP